MQRNSLVLIIFAAVLSLAACQLVIPTGWQTCSPNWLARCSRHCARAGRPMNYCTMDSAWWSNRGVAAAGHIRTAATIVRTAPIIRAAPIIGAAPIIRPIRLVRAATPIVRTREHIRAHRRARWVRRHAGIVRARAGYVRRHRGLIRAHRDIVRRHRGNFVRRHRDLVRRHRRVVRGHRRLALVQTQTETKTSIWRGGNRVNCQCA